MKKALAITLALMLVLPLIFVAPAVAADRGYAAFSAANGDAFTAFIIDISDLEVGTESTLKFTAVSSGASGYRVRLNTSTIDDPSFDDWCDGAGADPATGQLPARIDESDGTFEVAFTVTDEDKWADANTLWIVGLFGSHDFTLYDVEFDGITGGSTAGGSGVEKEPPAPPEERPPGPPSKDSLMDWSTELSNFIGGGLTDGASAWLKNSGDTSTKSISGSQLKVDVSVRDGGASNYCVIDFVIKDNPNLFAGTDYTLVVSFRALGDEPTEFCIAPVTSPWTNAAHTTAEGTSATLQYKFDGDDPNVRLQTIQNTGFYITNIRVYEGDPPETGATFFVVYALGAMALAGSGAVFAVAKLRKGKKED